MFTTFPSALSVIVALISSLAGLMVLGRTGFLRAAPQRSLFNEAQGRTEYLFDGEDLIDATPAARAMLPGGPQSSGSPWTRLMTILTGHFPTILIDFAALSEMGAFSLTVEHADKAPLQVTVELRGGLTRISLCDPEAGEERQGQSSVAYRALHDEVVHLRAAVAHAPLPMWRQTAAGDVVWANAAYLSLAMDRLVPDEDMSWPLPRLFDKMACAQGAASQRQRLDLPAANDRATKPLISNGRRTEGLVLTGRRADASGARPAWFDLTGCDVPEGRLVFATPSDAIVRAEASLRNFMQTLTKTFAQLSTGLAIFDHNRQLALFNPALVDLTNLSPDMLTARPSLLAFFDALRERSMIPEPRDYRSWRRQITDIEDAAANGHYQDVWNLSGGQTYRVTGRPHPNGALALLIEDISTEMSQTRRYQADLELGQAVIDAMDEAIAVFGPSGQMVMSNKAYSELWGHDPAGTLTVDGGIGAMCTHWRDLAAPSALWDRSEDFVAAIGLREPWSDTTFLRDGRILSCRAAPLAGGATLFGFRALPGSDASLPAFTSTRRTA